MGKTKHKTMVRIVSVSAALLLMVVHAGIVSIEAKSSYYVLEQEERSWEPRFGRRKLLESNDSGADNPHCHKPMHQKDSCKYVKEYCSDDVALANYLAMVACNMPGVKVLGYILMTLWLLYLISLLATTADYFFVPPLTLLSDKLRLSPSIAGITLLAIGNGAPDVFTAYSALKNNDIALLLGALIGASIFISTVVLGSVLLMSQVTSKTIDKIDFIRDIVAYMIVVGTVILVAFDGIVHLYEAILFPLIYLAYIAVVVIISFVRKWYAKRSALPPPDPVLDESKIGDSPVVFHKKEDIENINHLPVAAISEHTALLHNAANSLGCTRDCRRTLELPGLTWPRGKNFLVKIQWVVEYPFSILRWLTVPPCCEDGKWSSWHRFFAVVYPMPAMLLILVAVRGWSGFSWDFPHSSVPLVAVLLAVGMVASVLLFFLVPSRHPPHWSVQFILGLSAFLLSIAWLNIEANEVVSLLESFGIVFEIDTAILGLTVLAVGNSVGDWVADTAVARAGQPGMGVASCFGSPLLNDVLGFSVALIARIGIYDRGKPFHIDIHNTHFAKVKLSWIFLGIALVMSAVVFPLFRFAPPKSYGIVLLYIYAVFMIFSVLDEAGVLPFNL